MATAREPHVEQYRTLVLLAGFTGLRWGELVGLQVGDLELLRRRLTVVRSVNEAGEVTLPKNGRERTVPVPARLATLLSEACVGRSRTEYLFSAAAGGHLRPTQFRRHYWKPSVVQLGHPALVFHQLRHSYASIAVAAGATVLDLQNALGHASATRTLDRYAHLFDDRVEALGARLDSALGQTDSELSRNKAARVGVGRRA